MTWRLTQSGCELYFTMELPACCDVLRLVKAQGWRMMGRVRTVRLHVVYVELPDGGRWMAYATFHNARGRVALRRDSLHTMVFDLGEGASLQDLAPLPHTDQLLMLWTEAML